ncbi:Postreplication repair E3 ubiquitin-protein ligase rad-18 [Sporothrix brasiliensis 5110]|uniref:Postreplication repair E3 ubiquitin-protein ligase RAD18 n=1 Tax=Sporothrix brasiliensis 5110 TaxID=1398154 RepID=A0A0C2IZT6_9PEZI|nr:Postreplication repair E3 ubiquitin-protein ligase rad-18 [Sporothrix brasiliensis 5110]KIH92255.1 Postreplication repair E3 ubiquitin-protein ligase rad-18 [Sporothrix brasiliensis 5110]
MDPRDNSGVADSTDWLTTTLSCLMPVEQALRCHVCKDFYNSPMITSCNHTFCSLCIRRCLSVDGKCPLCRMTDQESKLRGNWALREAVDAFCKARPATLEVAQKPLPRAKSPTPPQTKRKVTDEATASQPSGSQQTPQAKRTRTSARLSKTKAAEAVTTIAQDEVQAEVPDSDSNSRDSDDMDYEPVSAPAPPPERLPSVSYSLLNDGALRKKMAALGLATSGSRQLLERRHKEWTTIWNANCDSARPKRKADLLHDMDIWERTVGGGGAGGGLTGSMLGGRGATLTSRTVAAATQQAAQIKDKEFDGAAWSAKHSTSFQDLIANARKSRLKSQANADEKEDKVEMKEAGPEAASEQIIAETPPREEQQTSGVLSTVDTNAGSNVVSSIQPGKQAELDGSDAQAPRDNGPTDDSTAIEL